MLGMEFVGDQRTGRTPDGKKELWRPNMSAVKAFISNVRATGKSNTMMENNVPEIHVEE
jgi:hypothetical protein